MFPDLLWNPFLCLISLAWFLRKCRNRKWVKNYTVSHPCIYIYKKRLGLNRLYPSRLGFRLTCRVDRVTPANFLAGFYLDPDRSQARVSRVPGRPAGPVRVLKLWYKIQIQNSILKLLKFIILQHYGNNTNIHFYSFWEQTKSIISFLDFGKTILTMDLVLNERNSIILFYYYFYIYSHNSEA